MKIEIERETATGGLTDHDLLYTLEASARASVTAYAAAAAMAYDPDLRDKFRDLTGVALNAHGRIRNLLQRLGGTV
ncbi:MAG: hypothetical protein IRY95_02675 [Clostridia bacterium]|nr:hypothetical protein [Clostridia bacterium]